MGLNKHLARILDRVWFHHMDDNLAKMSLAPSEEKQRWQENFAKANEDYEIFIKHHPELAEYKDNVSYMNACLQAGTFGDEPYLDRDGNLFPYKDERHG